MPGGYCGMVWDKTRLQFEDNKIWADIDNERHNHKISTILAYHVLDIICLTLTCLIEKV